MPNLTPWFDANPTFFLNYLNESGRANYQAIPKDCTQSYNPTWAQLKMGHLSGFFRKFGSTLPSTNYKNLNILQSFRTFMRTPATALCHHRFSSWAPRFNNFEALLDQAVWISHQNPFLLHTYDMRIYERFS